MEDLVATVKVFSQDKNWTELKELLNESAPLILKNAGKIDDSLASLDPEQNTLAYIIFLTCKMALPSYGDFELLFNQVEQLVQICCKEQVQQGVDKFTHICHFLTKCLIDNRQAKRGIMLMTVAIDKCQRLPSELTSVHSDLLQLCLAAKCFHPCLSYLELDITEINNEFGHYDTKSYLLYYYYGGLVYTALKKYEKALFFYEMCVTAPAMAVSHIMKEAYWKYILVSIYLHGKVVPLPKYVSAIVNRALKPLSSAYTELATAYSTYDADQLRSCANKHEQIFQRHNNIGMVKQVIESLTRKNIQRLTKTFITLSLADMANRVKLRDAREAEQYVLEMIEDGMIFASIDQPAGMVSFHNNPENYNSQDMLETVDHEMRQCVVLNEKLHQMDRELSVNPQYVQRVINMSHLDDAGKGDELLT